MTRVCVAIAGGTCAGKSLLAETLHGELGSDACVVAEDDFYPDRSHLSVDELREVNFDSTASIDIQLLRSVMQQLLEGADVEVPDYDRVTHRRSWNTRCLAPAPAVIFEGLHAIALVRAVPPILSGCARLLPVFVDCDASVRRERRRQRELTAATVAGDFDAYWKLHAETTFALEVSPQRESAEVVLPSPWSDAELAAITHAIRRAR